MYILVGQDTDVPINGTDGPADTSKFWDIVDTSTSTVLDSSTAFNVPGPNGWNLKYNTTTGRPTVHPPLGADATGSDTRYKYRINGALSG